MGLRAINDEPNHGVSLDHVADAVDQTRVAMSWRCWIRSRTFAVIYAGRPRRYCHYGKCPVRSISEFWFRQPLRGCGPTRTSVLHTRADYLTLTTSVGSAPRHARRRTAKS